MDKIKNFLNKRKYKKNISGIECKDCGGTLHKSGDLHISGCICFGFLKDDPNSVIYFEKNDGGVSISFNEEWDEENIQLLTKKIINNK
jgi:hypothetical protein